MKRTRMLAGVLVLLCLAEFAGCEALQDASAEESTVREASSEISAPSESPAASGTPAPAPTATLPPGVKEEARFYADLDEDGAEEAIVVCSTETGNVEENCEICVSVLDETVHTTEYGEGFFENAVLTDAESGEPCVLLVCYDDVGINLVTTPCSFDGLTPVMHEWVYGSVVAAEDSSVTLRDWCDAIGSWDYTREYALSGSFSLVPVSDMYIVLEGREPLRTIRNLPVEMLVNGAYTEATLPADTLIYPARTDAETYLGFTLKDGREGRVLLTRDEDYITTIEGLPEEEYFDNIEYWN